MIVHVKDRSAARILFARCIALCGSGENPLKTRKAIEWSPIYGLRGNLHQQQKRTKNPNLCRLTRSRRAHSKTTGNDLRASISSLRGHEPAMSGSLRNAIRQFSPLHAHSDPSRSEWACSDILTRPERTESDVVPKSGHASEGLRQA